MQYLPHEKDEFGLGGHVKREVEEHLAPVCQADPYLRAARRAWNGFSTPTARKSPPTILSSRLFRTPSTRAGSTGLSGFGAHSDIGLPSGLGRTPTVNFGPGDPAQSHQPNEQVSISDLVDCTKAIALAIVSWCRAAA